MTDKSGEDVVKTSLDKTTCLQSSTSANQSIANQGENENSLETQNIPAEALSVPEFKLPERNHDTPPHIMRVTRQRAKLNIVNTSTFDDISKHSTSLYYCVHCNFTSTDRATADAHGATHKNIRKTPPIASEHTLSPKRRIIPISKDPSGSSNFNKAIFECSECGFKSMDIVLMQTHVKTTHGNGNQVKIVRKFIVSDPSSRINHATKSFQTTAAFAKTIAELPTVVYKCYKCEFETLQKDVATMHVAEHEHDSKGFSDSGISSGSLYQCSDCLYVCSSQRLLEEHIQAHTCLSNTKMHKCFWCLFSTTDQTAMLDHSNQHRLTLLDKKKQEFFRCSQCINVYHSREEAEKHLQEDHSLLKTVLENDLSGLSRYLHNKKRKDGSKDQLLFGCESCSLRSNVAGVIKYHSQSAHRYFCKICDRVCGSKKSFQDHASKHKKLRVYQCQFCGEHFYTKGKFISHTAIHMNTNKIVSDAKSNTAATKSKETKIEAKVIESNANAAFKTIKYSQGYPHTCQLCCAFFVSNAAKQMHEQICGEIIGVCTICSLNFGAMSDLVEHVQTEHTDIQIQVCTQCEFKTIDLNHFANHILNHYPPPEEPVKDQGVGNRYLCPICEKYTSSVRHYYAHVSEHFGSTPYRCEMCEFATHTYSRLRGHRMNAHLRTERNVECTKCSMKFRSNAAMQKHLNKIHNQELNFPCQFCLKRFVTSSRLKVHLALVHFDDTEEVTGLEPYAGIKRHRCDKCAYSSYSMNRFRLHRASHRDRLQCPYCDMTFSLSDVLKRHVIVKHQKSNHQCTFCGRRFLTEVRLERHLDSTHLGNSVPHLCETCGFCFESIAHLEHHKRMHITQKDFQCPTCEKLFATAASLCVHRLRHQRHDQALDSKMYGGNSTWLFCCEVCKLRFKYHSSLMAHEIALHSGTGNGTELTCQYCDKTFQSKILLGAHIRKHFQEYSYQCGFCDKRFYSQNLLNNHETSIHTKDYKYHCPLCGKGVLSQMKLKFHLMHGHKAVDPTATAGAKRKIVPKTSRPRLKKIPMHSVNVSDNSLLGPEIIIATADNISDVSNVNITIQGDSEELQQELVSELPTVEIPATDILSSIILDSDQVNIVDASME